MTTGDRPASGIAARGYSWPPFTAGNRAALTHGANSPAVRDPLADQYVEALLADDDVSFLRAPMYAAALAAWGRAEAVVQLITEYIAANGGIDEAMVDVQLEETDETHQSGRTHRTTRTRRVSSALTRLDRAERHAAACRQRLGLDPLSRARLGRDVAAARVDLALVLSQLREDAEKPAQNPPGDAHDDQ